jgi:uncharacterized protein YutD
MSDTNLGSIYLEFGDIHSGSFEDYWTGKIRSRSFIKEMRNDKEPWFWNVKEYNIQDEIDYIIKNWVENAGQKPSMEELRQGLITWHAGHVNFGRAYFVIRNIPNNQSIRTRASQNRTGL